ncbi:MAG: FAD-dependent oxidoreductase [Chloroflexi bacterium]|nr:FAD-dependent oxidoreductase [Chloroflexota bacterium]
MPKYLIIGNSAGGIGAAEAIRELDAHGSMALVSDEPFPAYSRPLISEYLAGETTVEKMLYRSEDFYSKNNIEAVLGCKATRINLESRYVELADGKKIEFEKLLIATGGKPFVPPTEGGNRKGVFTFTTLTDAQQIERHISQVKRAVVIGGGLIGISVTEALVHREVAVTVVELKDRILNVLLDERGSSIAQAAVEGAGVQIKVNATVKRIVGRPDDDESVGGVVLDSGEEIGCDMVIVAIGVVPRTELVAGTPIKVNRGILVDRSMETSEPGVYACGDVAEAYDFVLEANRVVPIWPNAYIGGRVAGRNMAGVSTEYAGGTAMNSLKYFGLAIVSAGVVASGNVDGYEVVTPVHSNGKSSHASPYRKIVLKDNRLVGMAFVDDIERSGLVLGLMREKADVSNIKHAIVGDEFGLISMPREARQARLSPRNGAAPDGTCGAEESAGEDVADE